MIDTSRLFESQRARRKRIARNVAITTGATVALATGAWWAVRRHRRANGEPESEHASGSRTGGEQRAGSEHETKQKRDKPATPASGASHI